MQPKKIERIALDEVKISVPIDRIEILDGRREINPAAVKRLANSIDEIGLRTPVTVRRNGDDYTLVSGRHRIEACKKLGRETIMINIINKMTSKEARLWEISENLDRAELTKLERDEQIAEWIRLTDASQVGTHEKAGQKPGGINAAARDLGIKKTDAHRSIKVDSLSDEAKAAAVEHRLDNNRSALLEAAKESEPKAQVARLVKRGEGKPKPKPDDEDDIGDGDRWNGYGHAKCRTAFMVRADLSITAAKDAKQLVANYKSYSKVPDEAFVQLVDHVLHAWKELRDELSIGRGPIKSAADRAEARSRGATP